MKTHLKRFVHIHSPKFALMPGEKDEVVNEGIYGKALAIYLKEKLTLRGYRIPFYCCEDWGWWVHIEGAPFLFGICIYGWPLGESEQLDIWCGDSFHKPRKWSWRKWRFLDTAPFASRLQQDLLAIFHEDPEVTVLGIEDIPR
jgi:hypothetical protein